MKIKKTVSDQVIAANRKNAQKSTGPQSGAAKSALKYRAVKHGLLTKALLLENDQEEAEFQHLIAELEDDFKPRGLVQAMLLEDIAVSWWKLQTAQRLLLKELRSRHSASTAILNTFINAVDEAADPVSSRPDDLRTATNFGWECQELVLKVDGRQSEQKESAFHGEPTKKGGRTAFEAKLGNSAESLLRYESAWKRDLYRAIAALKAEQASETLDPDTIGGSPAKQSH